MSSPAAPSEPHRARRPGVTSVELGPLRDPFTQRVRACGRTPSAVLRELAAAWLGDTAGSADPRLPGPLPTGSPAIVLRGRVDGATERVQFRLTTSEYEIAAATARAEGFTLPRWTAALVRARLTAEPLPGEAELQALAESSYQLRAIGRNLNQIARALNIDGPGPGRAPDEVLLLELASRIDRHIRRVAQVVQNSQSRWALRQRP